MRVAAIYDIHANLPALEAALADIQQANVDLVVVGGDVLPGPMPLETLAYLLGLELPVRFIYGNGEVAVLEQMEGRTPALVPEAYRPVIHWTAQQLHADYYRLMKKWPATLRIEITGLGEVLFCHATPRSENECFTRLTPDHRLQRVLEGVSTSVVVCGHTHMQFDRVSEKIRVVNAGSVGMPFGEPGAYWLLMGPNVQLRRTPYDFVRAARLIRNTTYPQAEEFAARSILQPPSEEEMLAVFSRVELK